MIKIVKLFIFFTLTGFGICSRAEEPGNAFKVIAFYTAKNDQAHISFVHETNKWFANQSTKNHFQYKATNQWSQLNPDTLANYQVVIFLDTRPDDSAQRKAFQEYMEKGGGFMGFHFSAFALTPSSYPQDWDWYHERFLGSGEYGSNTWRPTSAILKVEDRKHPAMKHFLLNLNHSRTNGTAGKTISQRIPILKFWPQLILPVSRLEQVRKNTKSGTKDITRWYGPTSVTG
jgi:hypothetical protein